MSFYSVFRRKALLILLVAFALSCAGCASRQGEGTAPLTVASSAEGAPLPTQTVSDDAFEDYDDDDVSDISDPLEGWNRFWFKFNDVMLLHVIKPIYTGYTTVTPQPVRTGISNAFHNLQTPVRLVNCVLQGRFGEAWVEFGRFIVNTTAGFGGVFDVAKQSKPLIPVDNRDADFGQTLGVWGVGEGIYLVWPIAGPSTVRDTVGMVGDWAASPLFWTSDPVSLRSRWPRVLASASTISGRSSIPTRRSPRVPWNPTLRPAMPISSIAAPEWRNTASSGNVSEKSSMKKAPSGAFFMD